MSKEEGRMGCMNAAAQSSAVEEGNAKPWIHKVVPHCLRKPAHSHREFRYHSVASRCAAFLKGGGCRCIKASYGAMLPFSLEIRIRSSWHARTYMASCHLLVLCDRATGCMLQDTLTRAASRACLAPSGHLQEVMRSCCHSDACTAFPVAYGLSLGS